VQVFRELEFTQGGPVQTLVKTVHAAVEIAFGEPVENGLHLEEVADELGIGNFEASLSESEG
jgi:hypothetical protein